jgi:hypothetical protein
MNITLVRRGYSPTGGAENYLKRFAKALTEAGHHTSLLCTDNWPEAEWPYGEVVRLKASTPIRFANAVRRQRDPDSLLFSLERIWECDCYRGQARRIRTSSEKTSPILEPETFGNP